MWGSDAVLGTINFITKDGASIKGLQTSMDYSTVDNDRSLNVLFGNETQSGVNYMGSFTYFQSEGWKGIKDDGVANRLLGIETANGVDMANWNTWKPSWEMYGKAKINGFTLSARMLSFTFLEPYRDRPGAASGRQYVLDTAFLEAAYLKEIDDTMNVETKVFSDFEDKGRDPLFGSDQDMKQREIGWGLDSVLHKTFCDKHHLQFGVRANVINSGPNTLVNMNGDTGALTSSSTTSNMKYDQSGVDKTYGAYIEDQSDITEKLTLIAGARLDHNNWREKGTTFDPRWGVVYALTDKWTLKYLYNSGYYRPSVAQSKRVPSTIGDTIRNADQSLQSFDHDWQILYNDAKTTATVTWFFMSLNNYIAIGPASGTLEGGYMNLGRFNTKGLELDVRRQVMEKLSVYGNYAYALGSVADFADGFEPTLMGTGTGVLAAWMDDNNHVLNYPRHIYNIGFDWKFLKDCNLNVHMRAWADCLMRWGGPAYTAAGRYEANHQPGNQVFDTTILLENLFKKPLSLSLTCRNVFNRRAINPFNVGNYSWYYEEARSFDTHVTYKF
jgi:outer membrane receptor protein involved in Fe transport